MCRKANIMVMAYSPLGQGPLLRKPAPARRSPTSTASTPRPWRWPGCCASRAWSTIPKATKLDHVRANLKALDVKLDAEDLTALDAAFPPPKRATPLEMT